MSPESFPIQEAVGKEPNLTHNQKRRLEVLDAYLKNDLFVRMDADIKYRVDHKAWEQRQFDKDHLGK